MQALLALTPERTALVRRALAPLPGLAEGPPGKPVVVKLWGRAAFLAGVSRIQERFGPGILRMKGLVCFEGDTLPCEVHGVHGELYPLRTLAQWPSDERASQLVYIVRGLDVAEVRAAVIEALGQAPA